MAIRLTQRCFSTAQVTRSSIPGLKIYPNFLSPVEEKEIQERAIALHQKILGSFQSSSVQRSTTTAPSYFESRCEVVGGPVEIAEGKKINGQHFKKHNMEGHKWTDFKGNENLPEFIKNGVLSRILDLPAVQAFRQGMPLNWNFTLNTYGLLNNLYYLKVWPGSMEGSGCNKVSDSKDELTMIYSSGDESKFFIRQKEWPWKSESYPSSNSLVFLENKDCLGYKHYVMPMIKSSTPRLLDQGMESIVRIDLVFGCSRSTMDVERAKDLIFGERKYPEFTEEEKSLVDQYQEGMRGQYNFPNTAIDQEFQIALSFLGRKYSELTEEEKALFDKYRDRIFQANPARMI
jgi:hypothetical protein